MNTVNTSCSASIFSIFFSGTCGSFSCGIKHFVFFKLRTGHISKVEKFEETLNIMQMFLKSSSLNLVRDIKTFLKNIIELKFYRNTLKIILNEYRL